MTQLYSKEAKELALSAIWKDDFVCLSDHVKEIEAIDRLIENGNEVMELLDDAEMLLLDGAGTATAYAIRELIKKIKGDK